MKVNQLKAGAILSYASQGIHIISGLIYTPFMLRLLGQSEYGLYQFVGSIIAYLGLLSFGFGGSYIRYYSKYKVNDDLDGVARLNGMFLTVFSVIGLISLIAGSVLLLNVENLFDKSMTPDEIGTAKVLMGIMVFNLALSFPGTVFDSYILANEKYVFQRIAHLLKSILNPFVTLPFLLMGYKSVAVVMVQTTLNFIMLFVNIAFCRKKLKMSFDFKKFDFLLLKDLFVFSFWMFLNQIIDQINWSVDKFILGVVRGTVTVAVYGVASQLHNYYMGFSTAISSVFTPKINRIVAKDNDDNMLTDLFTRVGRIQFIILALAASGLVVFGKYFISLWAGEGYEDAYLITLLLVLPITIPLIQNLGIEIQRAKNMHRFRAVVYSIIAVINVFLSIPLSKYYGGIGAAFGTALSLIIGNGLIINIYYHKKIGLNIIYFWKQILKFIPALIMPGVSGICIMKFMTYENIFEFIGMIVLYTVVYGVSMWFFGMNDYEKDLISKPVKKIVSRGKK